MESKVRYEWTGIDMPLMNGPPIDVAHSLDACPHRINGLFPSRKFDASFDWFFPIARIAITHRVLSIAKPDAPVATAVSVHRGDICCSERSCLHIFIFMSIICCCCCFLFGPIWLDGFFLLFCFVGLVRFDSIVYLFLLFFFYLFVALSVSVGAFYTQYDDQSPLCSTPSPPHPPTEAIEFLTPNPIDSISPRRRNDKAKRKTESN